MPMHAMTLFNNKNPKIKISQGMRINHCMGDVLMNLNPGGIFGTPVGRDPDFRSQRTRTLGLTRDPSESQFQIVNTDNVD